MNLVEKTPESLVCLIGQCPAIFETDRGTYVVIGQIVQDLEGIKGRIGKNEIAIEIPQKLLAGITR